jgi:NAD(P)-dependent dehydrogenase (short-subunit alcohol dehydrogenase family)
MILKNKNILITGAGKGIGESCVNNFIRNGGFIYALIKDKKDNKKFKRQKNVKIYNGNVKNIKLISKIFSDSKKNKKPINCLVNNAGIRFRKDFLKIKKTELTNIFEINFMSIFYIMQVFSNFVIKNKIKGSVINISSIVGQLGFKDLSGYASSKGALTALTKSYSVEMSKFGIRANSISPGFVKTSFFEKFKNKRKKLYNWTLSRIPQNRWADPNEIAELIGFVLSDKSKYLNGENISIDGGWTNA